MSIKWPCKQNPQYRLQEEYDGLIMMRPQKQNGTVQKGKTPTITTGSGVGVVVPTKYDGQNRIEQNRIEQNEFGNMETLRVVELFQGIGQQASQLERLRIPFKSTVCEIDPKQYNAYCQIHGNADNLGDITKVDHLPDCNLLTYSFPCQDLSVAGNKNGMAEGSGTRSSLLWEVERLLQDAKERERLPEVLLMENVDAILFKQNKPHLDKFIIRLNELGYTSSYKVLNQTGFGIPQNRKRCFMVSTLHKGSFIFPVESPLQVRLKDFLEPAEDVPECYYLPKERIKQYEEHRKRQEENGRGFGWLPMDRHCPQSNPIATIANRNTQTFINETPDIKLNQISTMTDDNWDRTARVYDTNCQQACTTSQNQQSKYKLSDEDGDLRIRFLTPRECLRLMGQYDDAIDRIMEQCPQKTVQYRLAGNSIVVNVLEAIFKGIYIDNTFRKSDPKQTGLDGWC